MNDISSHVIIVDSSPLISFLKIGRIELLKVLEKELICTDFVRSEIFRQKHEFDNLIKTGFFKEIQIENPQGLKGIEGLYNRGLGRGEASSIILADSMQSTLLMDDIKAKKIANKRGINSISTAEVVVKNIQLSNISLHEADNFIHQWRTMGEFPVRIHSFKELL